MLKGVTMKFREMKYGVYTWGCEHCGLRVSQGVFLTPVCPCRRVKDEEEKEG